MELYAIVKKHRELQGMSRQELAIGGRVSLSAVSRYEKGEREVLSEENERRLLAALNLEITDGGVVFAAGSFIKIVLPSSAIFMVPNYQSVFTVLDMYKTETMRIYAHYLITDDILALIRDRVFHMEPAYSLIAQLPAFDVIVYFKMKRGYLTNVERELLTITEMYEAQIIRGISRWNVRFRDITRQDVEGLMEELVANPMGGI